MEILYQDNRILVCLKPHGVLSTDEPGGVPSLVREALGDPGADVRTVHRLDQVVSGLMNGLGLPGTSLRIALGANLLSVLLMYVLAAQPALQLWGAVIAMAAAQAVTLGLSLRALYAAVR